jgi:hypothetical protein
MLATIQNMSTTNRYVERRKSKKYTRVFLIIFEKNLEKIDIPGCIHLCEIIFKSTWFPSYMNKQITRKIKKHILTLSPRVPKLFQSKAGMQCRVEMLHHCNCMYILRLSKGTTAIQLAV